MARSLIRILLVFMICIVLLVTLTITRTMTPSHAAGGISGLSVSVGYAEDKHQSSLDPGAFPVPWSGSPNTIFLGNPVFGSTRCGTLPHCYDGGAIRLDNSGTSDVLVDNVSVDDHSSIPGGKVFSLWGSFTVPAGKSVILTGNPPGNNPNYSNFDTSGAPSGNCTQITVAPTITITVGGVPTTLVDSTHVLDTNGIDTESCSVQQNESLQWRPIGTGNSTIKTGTLTLSPATTTLAVGQQVTETATLLDGGGFGLANANITFSVTSGPNAGQTSSTVTDQAGHASFTYTDTAPGTDIVVASVPTAYTVGPFLSNQTSVLWTNDPTTTWSGTDIGSPALAGSDSLSNGVWTVAGSGTDIGGTADQFHFVWQSLTSDGGVRARVLSQTNTNSAAKAGVMLRQSTDPSAPFYAVVVTPQKGVLVLDRTTQGGGVHTVTSLAGVAPIYLQVQRTGITFTAYTSNDGSTWTPIIGSSATIKVTGTLLAGMAVTSHTTTQVNTATFDTVSTP
jgi:hypothetical protein